ncbi:uncharacterized protein LOC143047906 isoform X2 [Mytilus galloprovincialis]|uniref:uncharacterized protein LOC143047906 isoform X2 n=1 Tax=Mytilus galloprovincialis TaxID=29158 RepID=UPI003F7B7AFF
MQYGKVKRKVNQGNMKKKDNSLYSLLMRIIKIKAYCTNSKVSEVSQVSKATQTVEATLCSEKQYYEQEFEATYSSIDHEWLQLQEEPTIKIQDNLIEDDFIEDYEFWNFSFSNEDTDIILNKKRKTARKRQRVNLLCCSNQLSTE